MKALAAVLGIVMLAGCATPAQVAMRDDDDDHMPLQRMARGGAEAQPVSRLVNSVAHSAAVRSFII